MNNMSPEGFRTAAYLAAKARLDARKTSRNVQCNPPNTRCGNRCIPPSWDCRLKGEGADPHLRAVKTDPLGGLANIERGVRRTIKGVTKGSFSEVEGGKRAIIRGTVKIAPGNLQQKKELQKKLEDRTRAIGIGLAVVTGGLGIHAILMKNNTFGYRNGLGNDINNAVRGGISRVLDAIPLVGAQRARTREAVEGAVTGAATRLATEAVSGPDAMRATLGSGGEGVLARTAFRDHAGQLVVDTNRVNREAAAGATNFYNWNQRHREAFWNASIQEAGVGAERNARFSVFARPTAEEHLSRQFGLTADEALTTRSIKDAIATRLETERGDLIALAKQQGYRVSRSGGRESIVDSDLGPFMRGVVRSTGGRAGYSPALRRGLESHLEGVLTRSPNAHANTLYGQTVRGFNDYFREVGNIARTTAGASSLDASLRRQGYSEVLGAADRTRAGFLAGRMSMARPIAGDAHAELVSTAYFATRVAGGRSSTYSITDRQAVSAASELAGREITSTTDAFRLLQSEYGFTGATRVRASAPTTQSGARRSGGLRGQAQLSELARRIMARAGNEGMTMEAALRQARRERGDGDDFSPELVRTATYLAARADFKEGNRRGKPCGASHIPKAHECRKGRGAVAPQAQVQGKGRAVAAIVAAAGLTTAGILAYRGRQALVPNLSQKTIRALSSDQVKKGLDRIPSQFQSQARQLVGGAKLATAHMALRAQGAQIRAVDVSNNFSTWVTPNGTHLSVGSVGDSLLTFGAERKGKVANFPQYGLGFTVDTTFDSKGGMPPSQAKQLIATTKAMFKSQMEMLPDDAFLFAVPHKDDGLGGKRKSIYEKMGFTAVPGVRGDRLWALKNQGAFTKIPPEQFDYIRELIRGDSVSAGKACSESPYTVPIRNRADAPCSHAHRHQEAPAPRNGAR